MLEPRTRVLAIDDEPLNLALIQATFEERPDVELLLANNGREGLDVLARTDVDVVLLDLSMPVMNGMDVLRARQEEPRLRDVPVIVVTANREEKHRAFRLGANDFLAKPVDVEELRLRTLNYARLKHQSDELAGAAAALERQVAARTHELSDALRLAQETEREIALRLGRAAEFRDTETGAHVQRMSRYSGLLAELAGLPPAEVQLVLQASPLHDIGKVGIPDRILQKPGRLTPDEFETMKLHTTIGGHMLADSGRFPLLAAGRVIALQHHERFDGTGYPAGLAGDAIHPYGRIVAVADVFDALLSRRVYKPALPLPQVLEIMAAGRATHFDPALVDLLLAHLDRFLAIREHHLDRAEGLPTLAERLAAQGGA